VAKPKEFKLTLTDRVVGYFNPEKGVKRAVARHKMFNANVAFRGADRTLQPGKFRRGNRDINSELRGSLRELRRRSRDLNRNNAMAVSARESDITDVIGSGLRLESNIDADFLGLSRSEAQKFQEEVQRRYHNWASSELCDIERLCNWYQKQAVVAGAVWDSGDTFINLPVVNSDFLNSRVRVEVIEADRVSNPGQFVVPGGYEIYEGVKLDKNGAPVSYFLEYDKVVSGHRTRDWKEVKPYDRVTKSRKFLHVFEQIRPGQTRGYPKITSVITKLKELDEYIDAEIRAAVVAGLYTVFVTTNYGDIPGIDMPVEEMESGDNIDIGYGSVVGLAPGEDISAAQPGRPNPNVREFVEVIQADIGAGIQMPYETLVKRFNSSYSASRAALLERDKAVQRKRRWFADRVCRPVYQRWMDDMVLTGKIKAPGYFDDPDIRQAWLRSEWVGPVFREIDVVKTAQAALLNNKLGIVSVDRLIKELNGGNFEEVHKQLVYELEKRLEGGLIQQLEEESNEADTTPDEIAEPKKKAPQNVLSLTADEATRLMTELEAA